MSESGDAEAAAADLHAIQVQLSMLADRAESEPLAVAQAIEVALPKLAEWRRTDVLAWAQAIRAQARRFLDDLPAVLDAVNSGLVGIDARSQVAGQLHLEAGMTLNQFGDPLQAAEHLVAALDAFKATHDDSGQAWSLTSLAEAHSASGYPDDPLPLLEVALACAERSGDERAARRAYKQKAVTFRHMGDSASALDAITTALMDSGHGQPRANYLLEYGHIRQMVGDYPGAEEAYEEAAALYAEFGDVLGEANVVRALASNALLLGRNHDGRRWLDTADRLLREGGNNTGLAYVLRDRALVLLADGDEQGARADIVEGLDRFRASPDRIGLAGMLRSAARFHHIVGEQDRAMDLIAEAETITADGRNPLAQAGILALKGEIAPLPVDRLAGAVAAARLYADMAISVGQAHAMSVAALAHVDLADEAEAVSALLESKQALRFARAAVGDPLMRADHDFAQRDITRNVLTAAAALATTAAVNVATDVITDEAPLGLRQALTTGRITPNARALVTRAALTAGPDGHHAAHVRQHVSDALATLDSNAPLQWPTFVDVADARPEGATLIIGTPTSDGSLPVAWRIPEQLPEVALHSLREHHVDAIDALGRAFGNGNTAPLWDPASREWQRLLTDLILPQGLQSWLTAEAEPHLTVHLPPVISHVPVEAVLLNGEPLGATAAIDRLPVPTTQRRRSAIVRAVAYLDPDLHWAPERAALPEATSDPSEFRDSLGPKRLLLAGCHGDTSMRGEGALTATSGAHVLDAVDLLSHDLSQSIVVLEACHSGRYLGPRTGDPITVATVALLAGASHVVAGLFALPASEQTTGVITGATVSEILRGTSPPKALRRARARYLANARDDRQLPGAVKGAVMPGDAPWAWAGLVSYSA